MNHECLIRRVTYITSVSFTVEGSKYIQWTYRIRNMKDGLQVLELATLLGFGGKKVTSGENYVIQSFLSL